MLFTDIATYVALYDVLLVVANFLLKYKITDWKLLKLEETFVDCASYTQCLVGQV